MTHKILGFAAILALSLLVFHTSPAVFASDMVWQFRQADGSAGVGRKSAGLIFGVPETDDVQVQAGCESGLTRGKRISLVLGTDIGSLKDGDKITVRFEGGRFRQSSAGIVHGTEIEEGVTGAHVQLEPDDPLWQAMQQRDKIEYKVDGYRTASLKLRGGHSTIQRFINTCQRYATAASRNSKKSSTGQTRVAGNARQQNDGVSEREAFESAKELGTIEGWEAFLNAFPTGFRADLARAYVKRIARGGGQASTPTPSSAKSGNNRGAKKLAIRPVPKLDTFEARPGLSPWRTTRYEMDEGNSSEHAAVVNGNGVELLFHCDGRRLAGIMRESGRNLYPNFDRRVEQGLDAKRDGRAKGEPVPVPVEFSNGRQYSVGAFVMEMNGEVSLMRRADRRGFKADGSFINDMMSEDTITISAPPFVANLQLKQSRSALCSVIKKCGATAEGCGSTTKTYTKKKVYKKKKKKKRSCRPSGASCSSHRQCCGGKCCLNDFEECEGIGGTCDG